MSDIASLATYYPFLPYSGISLGTQRELGCVKDMRIIVALPAMDPLDAAVSRTTDEWDIWLHKMTFSNGVVTALELHGYIKSYDFHVSASPVIRHVGDAGYYSTYAVCSADALDGVDGDRLYLDGAVNIHPDCVMFIQLPPRLIFKGIDRPANPLSSDGDYDRNDTASIEYGVPSEYPLVPGRDVKLSFTHGYNVRIDPSATGVVLNCGDNAGLGRYAGTPSAESLPYQGLYTIPSDAKRRADGLISINGLSGPVSISSVDSNVTVDASVTGRTLHISIKGPAIQ